MNKNQEGQAGPGRPGKVSRGWGGPHFSKKSTPLKKVVGTSKKSSTSQKKGSGRGVRKIQKYSIF